MVTLIGCGDADHDGFRSRDGDCDDHNTFANPFSNELCNGLDDDCNGLVDDDPSDGDDYWRDDDDDGLGDPGEEVEACDEPDGYVDNDEDCDDQDDGDCLGSERLDSLDEDQAQELCDEFADQAETYFCDYASGYEFEYPMIDCDVLASNDCSATVDQLRACLAASIEWLQDDECSIFFDSPPECGPLEDC
jgi:hypothetical protein